MAVCHLTGGHSSPVLCVDVSPLSGMVASGSENGDLCLWSSTGELLHKFSRPDTDCTSVLFSREKSNTLYAAFGAEVLIIDTSQPDSVLFVFQSNQDEVNQVALDDKEQFLAACDDSGEIKVFGLGDRKVFKTLRFKHTNICSTVLFRSKRPWEVLSGGLDCRLVHWDFSRPKCLNQFNMQELHSTTSDVSAYMINPPFIHHLARSKDGSLTACALENGLVAVMDSTSKHLQEKFCLHAHQQGVAQVHFTSDTMLVSGGNDARIMVWDLSKAEQHDMQGEVVANGDSSPEDRRNESITEVCRVKTIAHPLKVNWLAPFLREEQWFVVVADQTSDLTVYPLS
ncbi:WD repeat-containing protein 53-like [Babylonia areolata]|uniref:WD repeat-containing protein 53-like n=1 Tax=Babylonia areolata TaxID=304850 RepID=UPI003FD4C62C